MSAEYPIQAWESADIAATSARTDTRSRPGLISPSRGLAHDGGMKITSTHTAFAIAATMLSLAACDRVTVTDTPSTRQETTRQKLDQAVESTSRSLSEAGDKLAPRLAEATERTKQHLAVAGEKTHQALSGAGDKIATSTDRAVNGNDRSGSGDAKAAMSDTAITASIKAGLLKDPDLSVLKIDVDTNSGVVTLNGLAGDEAARVRAAKMAEATKGVREVRNYLTLKRT